MKMKSKFHVQYFHDKCASIDGIVAFIDDDTFVRFDVINELFDDKSGKTDEMWCLRGFPIQLQDAPYYGKYYIWQDQWPTVNSSK